MHSIPLDIGAKYFALGFFAYQIDAATQGIFQIELRAKELPGLYGAIKTHQHIDITRVGGRASCGRAKQCQTAYAKLPLQLRLVLRKQVQGGLALHAKSYRRGPCAAG